MTFITNIEDEPRAFLESLPAKTQQIVRTKLSLLKTDPWPGKGGDKEKFTCRGKKPVYRLHIIPIPDPYHKMSIIMESNPIKRLGGN